MSREEGRAQMGGMEGARAAAGGVQRRWLPVILSLSVRFLPFSPSQSV